MQDPAMSSEAVLPETVQTVGVVEAKLTARPELAVALSVICCSAYHAPVMVGKVMVWEAGWT